MFSTILAAVELPKFDIKIFFDLAVILIATKVLGILMRKIGLPQVVGALIAGLLLGPFALRGHAIVTPSEGLTVLAQIGVVMIMFSAGLDTNLREIRQNGIASVIITSLGVLVPLLFGYLAAGMIYGFGPELTLEKVFIGVILTATSVGITVEVLKEMGKLKGKVGVSILSAAILDDIIGVVILSIVTSIKKNGANGVDYKIFLKVFGFFVFAIAVGVMCHYIFKFMGKKFPNKRRVPIISLAICFVFSYVAEAVFGIAAITGAYMAGIMLSNMQETQYVCRKVDINSYMIFSPVFFFNIGLSASSEEFSWATLGFAVVFVIAGLAAKFLGCGLGAKICKYSWRESAQVGLGMMARGEVCLIVAMTGKEVGLISDQYFTAVILLVVVSSLLTPILLKLAYKQPKKMPVAATVGPELPEQENLVVPSLQESNAERPLDMQASVYDELATSDEPSQSDTIYDALTNNDIVGDTSDAIEDPHGEIVGVQPEPKDEK